MMNDRRGDRWHVGKEIPITVIFAFIAQCAYFSYEAGTILEGQRNENKILLMKIDELSYQIAAINADRNDARKEQALMYQEINGIKMRVNKLENYMEARKWPR